MSTQYHDVEQGTDEWHMLRLGIVTASNINVLVTPTGKAAKGEKVRAYACEIASQRELRIPGDNFQSFDMKRGHIQEGIARDCYSENYSSVVE